MNHLEGIWRSPEKPGDRHCDILLGEPDQTRQVQKDILLQYIYQVLLIQNIIE